MKSLTTSIQSEIWSFSSGFLRLTPLQCLHLDFSVCPRKMCAPSPFHSHRWHPFPFLHNIWKSCTPKFQIWLFFIPASYMVFPFLLTLSWCLFFYDVFFPGFSRCCLHLCSSSWEGVKLTVASDIGSEWHKIQQKNNE